jgi:hypothetical protein
MKQDRGSTSADPKHTQLGGNHNGFGIRLGLTADGMETAVVCLPAAGHSRILRLCCLREVRGAP